MLCVKSEVEVRSSVEVKIGSTFCTTPWSCKVSALCFHLVVLHLK